MPPSKLDVYDKHKIINVLVEKLDSIEVKKKRLNEEQLKIEKILVKMHYFKPEKLRK